MKRRSFIKGITAFFGALFIPANVDALAGYVLSKELESNVIEELKADSWDRLQIYDEFVRAGWTPRHDRWVGGELLKNRRFKNLMLNVEVSKERYASR